MFLFLTFCFFIMAVILPSSRSSKGKPSAEAPSRLEQHLPKSAQNLVSSLSQDDREVLNYMLAFGLHMQMLAGLVIPATNWKPWKTSHVKVGLKRDHSFTSHFHQSVSGTLQKGPPLFAHKPSCTCDCFSCYASFWRRWAASPNRDLLNMIIEIAEMSDEGEEQKGSKGKEKKKKQDKKHIQEQEKCKGGKWKLQSTPQTSTTTSTPKNKVKVTPMTEIVKDTLGSTSMDVMYDALWDNISLDALGITDCSVMLSERKDSFPMKDELLCRSETDASSSVATMKIRSSRNARMETSSWVPSSPGRAPAIVQDELDGGPATQGLSPGRFLCASRQGKKNSIFHGAGKCKNNQIKPLVFEGTFVLAEEDQGSSVLSSKTEGSVCLRPPDANLRGKGFLSRICPDTLCGIASGLWDLVSMGSQSHTMDYY